MENEDRKKKRLTPSLRRLNKGLFYRPAKLSRKKAQAEAHGVDPGFIKTSQIRRVRKTVRNLVSESRVRTEPQPQLQVPDAARQSFEILKNEVIRLHFRWLLFKQLFVQGKRRVQLLNAAAPGFFYQLQFILLDDVVLGVGRLTDRPSIGRHEPLSLMYLAEQLASAGDSKLNRSLDRRLATLQKLAEPFRTHRNKRIAHLDAKHRLASPNPSLPGLYPNLIDQMLKKISDLMNVVEPRIDEGITIYAAVSSISDGDSLIYALRKTADWDELVKEDVIDRSRLLDDRYHDV